jgi:iron complex transport system ATP-binding protein
VSTANPAIRCSHLHARLGGHTVLRAIDLALPAARWTSIVGPNGAGKTTLLKSLAQLTPHSGRIEILGRDAHAMPARERAQAIAWLGQNEGGAQDLLARDVVMLGRLPHQDWLGPATGSDREAVQAAMKRTQCWDWRDRPLGQLSGGERQRVLLARALAVGAPVLMMDEPLANLDPPHQADWLQIVRAHVAAGGTAITVLHEITMALHADEMVVMRVGTVVHQGACKEPATHAALEDVFEGRIAVREVQGQWIALPDEKRHRIAGEARNDNS